jgi:nucleoside 2-deoxyribosyltransferase
VASPLGFSEPGRYYYARVLLPALEEIVDPVDPWSLITEEELAEAARTGAERELAADIGRRNKKAMVESELLVGILDGQELDSGTAAEIGYASALGMPCLGLRTDHRKNGEAGATVNLQVEAFIVLSGGEIVASLEQLLVALRSLLERGLPGRSRP